MSQYDNEAQIIRRSDGTYSTNRIKPQSQREINRALKRKGKLTQNEKFQRWVNLFSGDANEGSGQ